MWPYAVGRGPFPKAKRSHANVPSVFADFENHPCKKRYKLKILASARCPRSPESLKT